MASRAILLAVGGEAMKKRTDSAPSSKSARLDEEALSRVLRSGAVKAYQCRPALKFRDKRRGPNRGKGAAIRWLCEHVTFAGKEFLFWPFAKDRGHVGCVGYLGQIYKASRLMCALAHGAPPSDQHEASYTCGQSHKGCINPQHLAWKTQSENQRDQINQGRKFYGRQGKITFAQAAEIRAIGHTRLLKDVAREYGISPQRVSGILNGHGFTRQVKPWALRDGRFYSRIVFKGTTNSLGGFKTSEEGTAAYHRALDRLRRGEPAIASPRPKFDGSQLRRFYTHTTVRFGESEGERVISIEPEQEQTSFELYRALERLHPKVQRFVLSVSECGEIEEAAASVGFDPTTVAILLPKLKLFLDPFVH
jgi:hypothetical protein